VTSVYDLDLPAIASVLASWDQPSYRASQIWHGLYRDFHRSWSEFSNLPKSLRQTLEQDMDLGTVRPLGHRDSQDSRTRKTVFALHDGRQIETVLMRYNKRQTLCISSQAGCAMGCVFCATGQMGFKRHLSAGEIVAQVMYFAAELRGEGRSLTNIVVMGMGEPLHNYENTMAAIDRLGDPEGFAFGARRITISTVGLVPMIRRFADEKRQVNLAVSLHAADDELRTSMLPVNRQYEIGQVLEACRYYVAITHRRVSFEWALISGVNDTPAQAHKLAALLKGLLCHVNAIPLNPTRGYVGQATSTERALAFKTELEQAGIPCTIRLRRGIEIAAGCGQLAV
jgi:23S rRNA (adenine2503-C2)-methyltransferase